MSDENNKITTISISPTTKAMLRDIGKMGQTDDELVRQLADFWLRYGGVVSGIHK